MRHFIAIMTVVLWAMTASGAAPHWEGVDTPVAMEVISDRKSDDNVVEMAVKEGYIYISTSRTVPVKVFTILGQLISQESLTAGTHRLRMTARGVYILKVGSSTRRVTI